MRVALVHDHLTQNGGAERVLLEMMSVYPKAPVYTLVYDAERVHPCFREADVRTSLLQRMPGAKRRLPFFLPMMPFATESHNLKSYDVVLSSASAFAKGVITSEESVHICYCHTPTRYLWGDSHAYVEELPYSAPLRAMARAYLPRLRSWDRLAADRPDIMVANSKAVQKRIKKYYRRESSILYPPVNTDLFKPSPDQGNYFLTGGRLVTYKRFDMVIEAFNRLRLPLKIFGTGPDAVRLKKFAQSNIEFLGYVPEERLPGLFAESLAFLHPQEEDFGITAVEAMAAGKPVIAYAAGGALETVIDGKTGTFFDEQSWEALADILIRFTPSQFSADDIRAHAKKFSRDAFREGLRHLVEESVR